MLDKTQPICQSFMKTANLSRNQVSRIEFVPPLDKFSKQDYLISIRDRSASIPEIVLPVRNVLHLAFDDIAMECDESIADWQADVIAKFIKDAREKKVNLWVNCHAGVSRSGAIVELLGQLGWQIDESLPARSRIPNHLVFDKIRKHFPHDKIKDLKPLIEYIHDSSSFIF